jgi:hypothetical protein
MTRVHTHTPHHHHDHCCTRMGGMGVPGTRAATRTL